MIINMQAIASHLKVQANRIKSVDVWANCLFAVVKGLGARFVSKKVGAMHGKQQKMRTKQNKTLKKAFIRTGLKKKSPEN